MNQAINFFWTILCFIPVIGFWVSINTMQVCYVFIGVSLTCLLLPARLLRLSDDPKFYEILGVKLIRKFVQNGEYINKYTRKNNSQHKLIKDRVHAAKYIQTVIIYERYHFLCFIFFLLTSIYAIITAYYWLASLMFFANIIYNVCPLLLQQYNRARLKKLLR